LCGQTSSTDVIDASIAIAAGTLSRHDNVVIATSDPDDITQLTNSLGITVRIETV
ncbi:MAG: hypothetical protein GY724_02145, partial [Actinomycetia bacterium]|nr:hypothetical protein [Actinomycetes bacterium]